GKWRATGRVQQANGAVRDQRRLLRRLRRHSVAGGQCRGNLADEDRQREVPRRDRGEYATPTERPGVALAGGSGQFARPREVAAGGQRGPAAGGRPPPPLPPSRGPRLAPPP